jgi:hypothetical protein
MVAGSSNQTAKRKLLPSLYVSAQKSNSWWTGGGTVHVIWCGQRALGQLIQSG